MPLHVSSTMCSSPGGQNCIIQHLVSSDTLCSRPVRRLGGSSLNLCTGRPPTGVTMEHVWNVMAHAQKPDFVFRAKRTSPFKSAGGGRQFSRLLAAEVGASAVVMLDTPCSEIVWSVLATHCIRQFPLPCVTVCHQVSTDLYQILYNTILTSWW